MMNALTWFLTGLAFIVQPISYALSHRGGLLSTLSVKMGGGVEGGQGMGRGG